jgi:hypothetical protein
MRKQTKLEKEIESEIYNLRMIVLFENRDGFHQVLLNKKQFKKISDAACSNLTKPDKEGKQEGTLSFSGKALPLDLFEGMKDFYPQEYIENED